MDRLHNDLKYITQKEDLYGFRIVFQSKIIEGLNKLFATWKPREPYEFINANQYKKPVLNHNLIY